MNKDLILSLGDKVVRIDRGGPESRIGRVLAVEDDHITLLTEDDGVVYYMTHHIKSITDNAKQGLKFNIEIPEDFQFIRANNLKSVLGDLTNHWVQINRGGPEMLEGVLCEANEDYVTIVSNEEIIRLSTFHIRNISYGVKIEKQESEKSENNKKSENKESKENKESSENKGSSENKEKSSEKKDSKENNK